MVRSMAKGRLRCKTMQHAHSAIPSATMRQAVLLCELQSNELDRPVAEVPVTRSDRPGQGVALVLTARYRCLKVRPVAVHRIGLV